MSDLLATHPEQERLAAFSQGVLSDPDCATIEHHLAGCAVCQQALDTLPDAPLARLVRLAATSDSTAPPRLGLQPGYEILEEIGRGGMGVVYKARQAGLNRFVALKKIHPGTNTSAEILARFRREAEAVARLDHSNIVQIHEVGEYDGQLFLALEYVEGGSLADRLTGPLTPPVAADLVRTLALAIDHAHCRGIVHRDLKPANILLGNREQGTGNRTDPSSLFPVPCSLFPKISDFGLAKDLTRELGQTQTGVIVGTPSYMAPEQATGRARQIGPGADIYALGAILYQCLTGRPPFQGTTLLETLEHVRLQEPVPPSRLQPKVPRDLETICLKCLRKEPAQRYATAAELAEDLRRFLAGEAIEARPVPRWERVGKWVRHRPAAAGLIVLSGLAVASLIGGLWLHTVRLKAEVERAAASEARASKQRQRADDNYHRAREAINQLLARLDKFQARGVPQIEGVRRQLRKDALAFFEGVARAEPDADPAVRFDVAHAYTSIASLLEFKAGRPSLDHALLLLDNLITEEPQNRDYQAERGKCLTFLGNNAGGRGAWEESRRFREQALAVFEDLCRAQPDNAAWQRNLAVCHTNMGCCYEAEQRWPETTSHWQQAVRILEDLTARRPAEDAFQYQLAISYTNLAHLYARTGRVAESFDLFGKAEARLTPLVRAQPEEPTWRSVLAQTLHLWGAHLNRAGRGEEARPHLTRAVQVVDELIREDPSDPLYPELQIDCLVARTINATLLRLREEGEADWQRAVELAAPRNSWDHLCTGALHDARCGARALAAKRADYLAKQKGVTTDGLYDLAKAYAVVAGAAGKDSQLSAAERRQQDERCAAAAVALLARLNREGYFNPADRRARLKKEDADLELLRSRSDFQKLLAELPAD